MALEVKEPLANVGDVRDAGLIPGLGRSLEKDMATHSTILAWRIPWTEEPGGLQIIGSHRDRHDLACTSLGKRNFCIKVWRFGRIVKLLKADFLMAFPFSCPFQVCLCVISGPRYYQGLERKSKYYSDFNSSVCFTLCVHVCTHAVLSHV